MRRSAVFGIKYFVLSIFLLLLLTTFYLLLTPRANAQTIDYKPFCDEIAIDNDPGSSHYQAHFPQDSPDPEYREPPWEELDETEFKTIVADTFQMIDVPGPAGRGGRLSSQSLLLPNAKEVADYLEGAYLDEDHRLKDLRTLKSQDFQSYFGSVVKITPQKIQDRLKVGYVGALYFDGRYDRGDDSAYKTPDINFTYSDVCGQNPRTIYDLVQNWEIPQPPSLKDDATLTDWYKWRHTWGKYWPKIPLHDPGGFVGCDSNDPTCRAQYPEGVFGEPPNMLSQGCLVLKRFGAFDNPPETDCPDSSPPNIIVIKLGVPDLARLDVLARYTQQLLLPQKLMNLYFCKFRSNGSFCENNQEVNISNCGLPQEETEAARLGQCAENKGEQGVGGTAIKIYDPEISILGGSETVEIIKIESRFPYLGLTFGKLTSALVGTFKFFDPLHAIPTEPLASWLDQEKYQQNSTKLPYTWSFTDTTIPVPGGHITEPPVWAGFLSGIKKSKNFVICTLLPSPQEAATCANENLQYNPVSR